MIQLLYNYCWNISNTTLVQRFQLHQITSLQKMANPAPTNSLLSFLSFLQICFCAKNLLLFGWILRMRRFLERFASRGSIKLLSLRFCLSLLPSDHWPKDSLSTTRHSGRTLTVGQGNYLSRYLKICSQTKS